MKKMLLGVGAVITSTIPVVASVSCGSDNGVRHIVTKETQRLIQTKLNEFVQPLGNLTAGADIRLIMTRDEINNKIHEVTKNVSLVDILIDEKPVAGGDWSPTSEYQSIEEDHQYRLRYHLGVKSGVSWEGTSNSRIDFTGETRTSVTPVKDIDPADFTGIKFANSNFTFAKEKTFGDLTIDDSGKSWKDKVDFRIERFIWTTIGDSNWSYAESSDSINLGQEVKASLVVTPKPGHAWKDGTFGVKSFNDEVSGTTQIEIDLDKMKVRYPNIIVDSKVNINLYNGWSSDAIDPDDPFVKVVELYTTTSQSAETRDPSSLTYADKVDIKAPATWQNDAGQEYMSHDVDLSLDQSNKYVNFKLVYKDMLKSEADYPYIIYDQTSLEAKLPFDIPNDVKIVRDGNDLILYTYSILYKQF